ncbi:MAG TPA: thioredoxin domain-containing protein [Actinomycetota bacterium]|nr:thioredoxin domain-containing protein [Actinomycetota bacterium]
MTFVDDPTDLVRNTPEHSLGHPDASVTLTEFGEFECPHCGRAYYQLKGLRDRLVELDVRLVWRHLARDDVHPFSTRAAVAAEAAGAQGLFWEMHDLLFEHQHSLEYEDLRRHATAVGLDVDRFLRDMADPRYVEIVRAHGAEADRLGIDSTPSFLLNGERYTGDYDMDSLVAAIERERA